MMGKGGGEPPSSGSHRDQDAYAWDVLHTYTPSISVAILIPALGPIRTVLRYRSCIDDLHMLSRRNALVIAFILTFLLLPFLFHFLVSPLFLLFLPARCCLATKRDHQVLYSPQSEPPILPYLSRCQLCQISILLPLQDGNNVSL